VPGLSAYARWSPFDGLVFVPFYGEARPPALARTSATRFALVTLGPWTDTLYPEVNDPRIVVLTRHNKAGPDKLVISLPCHNLFAVVR
jgi:hypothetical protein